MPKKTACVTLTVWAVRAIVAFLAARCAICVQGTQSASEACAFGDRMQDTAALGIALYCDQFRRRVCKFLSVHYAAACFTSWFGAICLDVCGQLPGNVRTLRR